jgi:hypothetical protein
MRIAVEGGDDFKGMKVAGLDERAVSRGEKGRKEEEGVNE